MQYSSGFSARGGVAAPTAPTLVTPLPLTQTLSSFSLCQRCIGLRQYTCMGNCDNWIKQNIFNAIHVFQSLRFSLIPARGTLITANQGLVLQDPDLQCTACCIANQDSGVWVVVAATLKAERPRPMAGRPKPTAQRRDVAASNSASKIRFYMRNQITVTEKSNRTKLTLFTWVNTVCLPIFTVNQKGTAKFVRRKNEGLN